MRRVYVYAQGRKMCKGLQGCGIVRVHACFSCSSFFLLLTLFNELELKMSFQSEQRQQRNASCRKKNMEQNEHVKMPFLSALVEHLTDLSIFDSRRRPL
jgi:hypothetical protein